MKTVENLLEFCPIQASLFIPHQFPFISLNPADAPDISIPHTPQNLLSPFTPGSAQAVEE